MSAKPFSQNSRYVICIPHGGMNDTFVQIQKCIDYCNKFNRDLILDTRRSGLFLDFDRFFNFELNYKLRSIYPYRLFDSSVLNECSVYPSALKGLIGYIPLAFSSECQNFTEKESGVRLTFDHNLDYSEKILVHEQCGGGTESFDLISSINFSEEVSCLINEKLIHLPENYAAIHVRNSDYKTDYENFFQKLSSEIDVANILICSDDINVKNSAQNYFKKFNLFFTDVPMNAEGRPLHHATNYLTDQDKFSATVCAFADLIALARSGNLFFSNVILNSQLKSYPSGFSRLANFLNENKHIVNKLFKFN